MASPLRGRRLPRRLVQLYVGLTLYGVSAALQVRAALGVDPWDVFHLGIAKHTGLTVGLVSIIVGALVLLLWLPLKQKPGLGTISNVFLVGLSMDATMWLVSTPGSLVSRGSLLVLGIFLNGVATGMYVGAKFGPGPRDGLMTGLAARGYSIRVVRTGIELTVLAIGWLLGGPVGIGTVLYALTIGPLAHVFIPLFTVRDRTPTPAPA